jgi:dihydrofolate reductase
MGKLIVSSLVSLDGGQHAPQSWASEYFDEQSVAKSVARLEHCDAMVMGRHTYEYLQPSWSSASGLYLDRINSMRKYVFSSTLRSADWNNSQIPPRPRIPRASTVEAMTGPAPSPGARSFR